MGCLPLFCCFKTMKPKVIAMTALAVNIIALAFLIWGVADLSWDRNSAKVLYIISFVLFILLSILIIMVLVFLNMRNDKSYITYNKIGKILCLLIIALCALAFIFLLVAEILEIKDYADYEKLLPGRQIASHDWAAAILPGLLGLITLVIIALCANVLYKIFNDNILISFLNYQNALPIPVNQNSMTTLPNYPQNPVIIKENNSAVMPPVIQK